MPLLAVDFLLQPVLIPGIVNGPSIICVRRRATRGNAGFFDELTDCFGPTITAGGRMLLRNRSSFERAF